MARGVPHDEVLRLLFQVVGAEDLDDLKAKAQAAGVKLDDLSKTTAKAEKSTRNMGRATLEGGRILQDFAQGGIGGILNNIEGMATALGGGPGLAGVMTALGLAAWVAIPAIKSAWSAIADGSHAVPDATDRLEGLRDRLGEVETRLKDLKEKGWLTDAELNEYNDKLAKRAELEERIATAKEAQAAVDGPTKEEKAAAPDAKIRADFLANSTAWGSDEAKAVRDAVAEGTRARIQARLDEIDAALAEQQLPEFVARRGADGQWFNVRNPLFLRQRDRHRRLAAERAGLTAEAAGADDMADGVVAGVASGDPDAIRKAISATPDAATRKALREALDKPESLRRGKEEADREKEAKEVEKLEDKRRQDMESGSDKWDKAKSKAEKDRIDRNKAKLEQFTRADTARSEAREREEERAADEAQREARREAERAKRAEEQAAREAERESLPGNQIRAMRDHAYQTAAGIAMEQNDGSWSPAQLDAIAREAADSTPGLDYGSIQQAVNRAAALLRRRFQADMARQMGRMWQGGDSYLEYGQ